MAANNPYNDQHYELACQISGACGQVYAEIQRMARAGFGDLGVPLAEMQQENDTHKQAVQAFKREYFPGRP